MLAELGHSGEAGSDKTMNMVAKVTNTNIEMTPLKIILDFKFSAQNVEVLVTTLKSKTTKTRMGRITPNEAQV